jgi:polyphosphate glucokinase
MKSQKILGIDIGGSGIKGAPINVKTGKILKGRYRLDTPDPSSPKAIAEAVVKIVKHFKWKGPVGCGFPGVIQRGFVRTAANVDKSWIDTNINKLLSDATGLPVYAINDADAAGLAEMKFGAGKDMKGVVLLLTVGTGIGTVLFSNGKLVPNLEMGHIELHGMDAEKQCSDAVRKDLVMSWEEWAKKFNEYLLAIHALLWPDLIILGGGASKKTDKFLDFLKVKAKIVPAKLLNEAGLVGAAIAAKNLVAGEKKNLKKAKTKKAKTKKAKAKAKAKKA